MSTIRFAFSAFFTVVCWAGTASDLSEGEIRKVDKDHKKLTIKRSPLRSLEMPGMTMMFGVKDDAMLEKLETDAKVRFQAEKIDGKIVVAKMASLGGP